MTTPDTAPDPTPAWVAAWRAVARYLPTRGLRALAEALASDSPAVQQGAPVWTRSKVDGALVPLIGVASADGVECHAADPIAYAAWRGDESLASGASAGQVYRAYALAYAQGCADLGTFDGAKALLNFIDTRERGEVRVRLGAEVERTLAERERGAA